MDNFQHLPSLPLTPRSLITGFKANKLKLCYLGIWVCIEVVFQVMYQLMLLWQQPGYGVLKIFQDKIFEQYFSFLSFKFWRQCCHFGMMTFNLVEILKSYLILGKTPDVCKYRILLVTAVYSLVTVIQCSSYLPSQNKEM